MSQNFESLYRNENSCEQIKNTRGIHMQSILVYTDKSILSECDLLCKDPLKVLRKV